MVWVHTIVWTIYFAIGIGAKMYVTGIHTVFFWDAVLSSVPSIVAFYACFYILDIFVDKNRPKRVWFVLLAELAFFPVFFVMFWVYQYRIRSVLNPKFPMTPMTIPKFAVSYFWTYLLYSMDALGYFFYIQAVRREKRLRDVELKQLQMEQNRLQSEYAFLNAQINPHFLYNTLNFFYAKSLNCSKELSEGILTLSEIMRYSLEPNESMDGKVTLSKEVEHLKNVIKINQLRFSNTLHLDFVILGDITSIRIIPLVLITLVENAFKHGDLTDPYHPVRIRLEVNEDQTRLQFTTFNKRKAGPKELSHGIGIENIRKRLYWTYHDFHTFETGEVAGDSMFYAATLTINFQAAAEHQRHLPMLIATPLNSKPDLQ